MMKKHICIVLLLILLLCGCSEDVPKVSFDDAAVLAVEEVTEFPEFELTFSRKGKFTEDGVFLAVDNEGTSTDTLCFADNRTDEIYPLCARPNCTHDTEDCPARMAYISDLHCDGEYLYFVSGSPFSGQCIMRQRIDGSDRQELFGLNAAENGVASIGDTLYHGDTLYFTTFGAVFDPETEEIASGERICIGDLKTGEYRVLPLDFGEGDTATTGIPGVCGKELVLSRVTGSQGIFWEETYRCTYFLLDTETCEITIIGEYSLQDRESMYTIGDSLLYFELDWTDAELVLDDEIEGELRRTTCDIMVVDLRTRKAYLKKDVVRTTEMLSDEIYIYYEWNEDYTAYTKMVKDLKTGEVRPYPENIPPLLWPIRAGNYLYAQILDGTGGGSYVRILEEDFWAGDPDFYTFPDWAENGINFS